MSLLSYEDLVDAVEVSKTLSIDPYDRRLVQPSSIDVRLDHRFRLFSSMYGSIDPSLEQPGLTYGHVVVKNWYFLLEPGKFALASTQEVVTVGPNIAIKLEGKSSLARYGLMIHTAGLIDPGFSGHITLELSNVGTLPIKLWPGMKIGQLCVFKLSSPTGMLYGDESLESRYQNQNGPTESKSWLNFTTGVPLER
jgi:dCTP deaminase